MSVNTAIASTQQAGQGDAVILGNNSQPIVNTMLAIGAQNKKQQAQEGLLNKKQTQENATKFYSNLGGLKEKIWDADLGRADEKIGALITKAIDYQKKGVNPFSPENMGAYADLYGDIEKLQLFQEASKSAEQQYLKGFNVINSDKSELYDKDKGITALQTYRNLDPIERAKITIDLPLQPVKFQQKLDKIFTNNLQPQLKVAKEYADANMVDKANEIYDAIKLNTIPAALSLFSGDVQMGRTTPDEIASQVNDYIGQFQQKALYNPNKDQDQAFKIQKQAEDLAIKQGKLGLDREKFQYTKAMNEVKSTEVDDLFKSIKAGLPVSAMSLSNQTIQNPKTGELVVTGAFTPVKNKKGEIVGVSIETFTEDENGVATKKGNIVSPIVDTKGNPIYSTTQIYKSAFATSAKNKAPVTNYTVNESGDFEIIEEDQKQVGSKNSKSESVKTSKTTTQKMTPAQWNVEWGKLKSGQSMKGLDGNTYKKK